MSVNKQGKTGVQGTYNIMDLNLDINQLIIHSKKIQIFCNTSKCIWIRHDDIHSFRMIDLYRDVFSFLLSRIKTEAEDQLMLSR